MDKLAEQLRADADDIQAPISKELDARIEASLHAATQPERPERPARPAWFLWASSLTGIAAAAAVLVLMNRPAEVPAPAPVMVAPIEIVDWNLSNAVLTKSLDDELEAIESDLKKAEQIVREDLDDIF